MDQLTTRGTRSGPLRLLAAALAVAAGLIHLAVTPEHLEEATVFGLFMLVVGLAQLAAGALLLLRPSRVLLLATLVGTVAVFVVFAVAYTVGVPVGPHPWEREELGPVVLLSKLVEFALLLTLAALVLGPTAAGTTTRERGGLPS